MQNVYATSISDLPNISLADTALFQHIPNHKIGFFEDSDDIFNVQTINNQHLNKLTHKNIAEIGKEGFKYWAVLRLKNPSNFPKTWWLQVPGNYVDAWIQKANGTLEEYQTGNLLKQKDKSIKSIFRNFNYLPVNLDANESLVVKLHIRTNPFFPIYQDEINLGLPIHFQNWQNKRLSNTSFLDGMHSAMLMVFCLYCLFYFLQSREIFAFWVVCFALSMICYYYQFNSTWYRLGMSPVLVNHLGLAVINLTIIFNYLFIKTFINLKSILPRWNKAFKYIIYVLFGFVIFLIGFYYFSEKYFISVIMLTVVHAIFHIPKILLAFRLLSLRNLGLSIFSVGLITCDILIIYMCTQLLAQNTDLLKIANGIYIIGILISLSLKAASSQQQKIQAEAARLSQINKLEELQKLDGIKSNFFANVSHELRTPLTMMIGPISSVIKSNQLSNRNFTLLKKAQQNGQDLLKLIGSILDLSKMEANKMELREETITLFSFIARSIANFESYAQQKEITFIFNYQAEKLLKIAIDKNKLQTILNNLLANAIKFTSSNGKIVLDVQDQQSHIFIKISDTGRGIHPEDLPHVFNRFYQSNQPDAPTEGGTGIGLALSQEFISLMNGTIEVESVLGEGSVFSISFPRKEVFADVNNNDLIEKNETIPTDNQTPIQNSSNNKKRHTILVVEDNRSLRDYLKVILSPYYQVMTAENGLVALEMLNHQLSEPSKSSEKFIAPPSLILSDIMMPTMDGYQLLKVLKSKDYFRHIPVIMLTARAEIQDKLKALRIGVDDYLLKPFEEEELIARINNLLKNAAQRHLMTEAPIESLIDKSTTTTPVISQEDQTWLESLEQYLLAELANSHLTIPELANEFAMTERSFQRQLKRITGISPSKYVQEIRLNHARQLLENQTYNSISRVAHSVGFKDSKTFSRNFKRRFGKTPSEYLNT